MAAVSAAERETAACSAAGSPAEPVSAELVPVGAAAEASENAVAVAAAASRASGTYSPAGREIAAEAAVEPSAEAGCTTAASDYWGHWFVAHKTISLKKEPTSPLWGLLNSRIKTC